MEPKKFYIKGDIDFNDLPLEIIDEKKLTSQKDNVIERSVQPYKSIMQKSLETEEIFKVVLNNIEPIDFQLEAMGENIKILRQNHTDATDLRTREILERKIEKLSPNNKQKYVIISRHLLELAEQFGFGMGIYNEDFYYFNSRTWVKKDKSILIAFLGEFAEKAGLEKLEALQFKTKEDLYSQFQVDALIPFSNSQSSEIRIPVQNGTLIFNNGEVELTGFNKDHFLRYILPFEYNPEAKAPVFNKYFNRVLPDESLQKICFEFIGSVYTSIPHEKTLFLLGSGANGKSIFYNITAACFGKEKITTIPLEELCAFQSQSTALLENTLINFCPDISDRKFDVGLFKRLVSRERIPVKEVYKKVYHIENYGRLAFNCNSLPKEPENSDAFHRRLLIVRFGVTIPEKERDFDLANKIITNELPGFFNFVIDGMKRLIVQDGFSHSDALVEELHKYRTDSNSVLSFLDEERYISSHDSKIAIDTFYSIYKEYCSRNGFHSFGVKKFNSQLRNAKFKIERSTNGYYYIYCEKIRAEIDFDGATIIKT